MRWACLLVITTALLGCIAIPAAAAGVTVLTISAFPNQTHIGDTVTINGTITRIQTIAVYLFLTGPDLDNQGVTLDNLNIPAGCGLFTTAPVDITSGRWSYSWDTSVILGNLKPGKFTVYAVSSPIDRFRYAKGDSATAEVEFLPAYNHGTEASLEPAIPIIAVGFVAALGLCMSRLQEMRK